MIPSVSVIIPVYNHGLFIAAAIESVLAQTLQPHEVIIVDDGSTDETPQVVARYGKRVHVIRQHNQGPAAARNSGCEKASGDLLAFLDADDIWLPQKLARQVPYFSDDPQLGLIHCGYEEMDVVGTAVGCRLDGLEGSVAAEMLLARRPVILGAGSTAIIPRKVFEQVGGFDPNLPPSEDWDLCFRIANNYKVKFVSEVLVRYRLHGANSHLNVKRMEQAMLLAYTKAFHDADPQLRRLRRRSYANLHAVLAGCFLSARQYPGFIRNALKSLLLVPDNFYYIGGYLGRRRRHPLKQDRYRVNTVSDSQDDPRSSLDPSVRP